MKRTKKRSVAQAIRDYGTRGTSRARPVGEGIHSHWQTTVTRKNGKTKRGPWRHNVTTTTATGYTNALDWLAKLMGAGPSGAFATAAAWPSAAVTITGTTLTNSGAAFPTAGQGLAGSYVFVFGLTSQTIRYGVIASNTATALTVDQWYDMTSTAGAVGATPTTSGGTATTGVGYAVVPGQGSASWMAVTSDAVAPTTADTTLASEATTNGFARAVGTYAHTAGTSTYTLVHLWTATGALTVNKEAQFGAATTTAGGVMPFESAEPTPPAMLSGDTLQNTATITI